MNQYRYNKITKWLEDYTVWAFLMVIISLLIWAWMSILVKITPPTTDCFKREYLQNSNGNQIEYTKVTDIPCPGKTK